MIQIHIMSNSISSRNDMIQREIANVESKGTWKAEEQLVKSAIDYLKNLDVCKSRIHPKDCGRGVLSCFSPCSTC